MIFIDDIPAIEVQKFIQSNLYVVNELKRLGVDNISHVFGCEDVFCDEIIKAYKCEIEIDFSYIKSNLAKFNINLDDFDVLKVIMMIGGAISCIDMWLDALYKISTNHEEYLRFKDSINSKDNS